MFVHLKSLLRRGSSKQQSTMQATNGKRHSKQQHESMEDLPTPHNECGLPCYIGLERYELTSKLGEYVVYIHCEKKSTNEPHSLCLFSQWCILKRLQSIRLGYKKGSGCQGCKKTRTFSITGMLLFGILGDKCIRCIETRMSMQRKKRLHMGSCLICFESSSREQVSSRKYS